VAAGSGLADEPRYRGQTLKQWAAALDDLDPGYRGDAAHALRAFGDAALPHLRRAATDPSPAVVLEACQSLLELGAAGEFALGQLFSQARVEQRHSILSALASLGPRAQALVPLVETAAARPETTLPALQALAAIKSSSAAAAGQPTVSSPDGDVVIDAGGCVASGLFPLIEVRVRESPERAVANPRLFFRANVTENWYYVKLVDRPERASPGWLAFDATLPRPPNGQNISSIHYFASVYRGSAEVTTPEVSASIVPTPEGCEAFGRPPMRVGTPGVTAFAAERGATRGPASTP
jgi:hypothetical protein